MITISPSIASSDTLNLQKEIDFVNKYFDSLHIDIEDGNAVNNISFGFKTAKKIFEYSKAKEITIHLETYNPLKWLNKTKECNYDVVFLQTDVLEKPLEIAQIFKDEGLNVGINLSNTDFKNANIDSLIQFSNNILINTTHHDDPAQICDDQMIKIAIDLANKGKRIWIDGGINFSIIKEIFNTNIYSAVMGRAIFEDKESCLDSYRQLMKIL